MPVPPGEPVDALQRGQRLHLGQRDPEVLPERPAHRLVAPLAEDDLAAGRPVHRAAGDRVGQLGDQQPAAVDQQRDRDRQHPPRPGRAEDLGGLLALALRRGPPAQLALDQVEEGVHLVLVIAAAADPRLAEGDLVHLVGGHPDGAGRQCQRVRDLAEEVVDLDLVVAAAAERRLAELDGPHVGGTDPLLRSPRGRRTRISEGHDVGPYRHAAGQAVVGATSSAWSSSPSGGEPSSSMAAWNRGRPKPAPQLARACSRRSRMASLPKV